MVNTSQHFVVICKMDFSRIGRRMLNTDLHVEGEILKFADMKVAKPEAPFNRLLAIVNDRNGVS